MKRWIVIAASLGGGVPASGKRAWSQEFYSKNAARLAKLFLAENDIKALIIEDGDDGSVGSVGLSE